MEQTLNCIIIEDELPAIRLMEKYVNDTAGLQLSASFRKTDEALAFVQETPAGIIFCDIQMPGMTGLELVKKMRAKSLVVFTTAYSEFAAEAYDLDAIDYLKKPFSYDRFLRAVQKAKEITAVRHTGERHMVSETGNDFIAVRAGNRLVRVAFDEILFLEAFQEYVKIITTGQRLVTFERLKNMENLLPPARFLRVHRSYIVNREKVRSISGNMLEIDQYQVPVSRELKNRVVKMLF